MPEHITVSDIQSDPSCIAASLSAPSGLQVTFRPLAAGDAGILGPYFAGLSQDTRRRFAPHAFDQATADRLCATIDYAGTIPMVATIPMAATIPMVATIPMIATVQDGPQERVVAYFICALGVAPVERERYARAGLSLDPLTDCTVAPSVADAYQDRGLGSCLMGHLIQVARRLGRKRLVLMGGVQATNARAVHYYQKHGFRTVSTFESPAGLLNHDMMLDLGLLESI
jgi:GNAT superfamily N-acetyltransferase